MTDKVRGLGLYLELVPTKGSMVGKKTTQILFTPEGIDEKGNYVKFAMFSRTVSDWSPRKQWRATFSLQNNNEAVLTGLPIPEESLEVLTESMVSRFRKSLENYLASNVDEEMVLRGGKPIVLEITSLDLDEVSNYKAPAPALRRLQKVRLALGLPEKLV